MGPQQREEARRLFIASSPRPGGLIDEAIRRDMDEHPEGQPQQQQHQQQQQGQAEEVEIIHEMEVRIWKILAGNVAGNKIK